MTDEATGHEPGAGIDHTELVAELRSVLASPAFATSPTSRAFLTYVVTETLSGRGERLTARRVGRHSTGAPNEGAARVQATRMRQGPAEPRMTTGRARPLRIGLPAVGYAATFERHVPADDARARRATRRRLGDGRHAGRGDRSRGQDAGDGADRGAHTHHLVGFPGLRVVGPVPSPTGTRPRDDLGSDPVAAVTEHALLNADQRAAVSDRFARLTGRHPVPHEQDRT